jgi:hypothetical protein
MPANARWQPRADSAAASGAERCDLEQASHVYSE